MTRGKFLIRRTSMPGVEAVEAETAHVFSRHTHDQFGIGVIRRGAQKSLSGRGIVEAGPGDVITVNPGEVHDGMPIGDAGRAWTMLYFDPAVILEALGDAGAGGNLQELHSPVSGDREAAACLVRLHALLTAQTGGSALESDGLLLRLVHRLVSTRAPSVRGLAQSLRRARELLNDAPAENWRLADLAAASGLSRFQVLRGFSKETGMTPHAYLMQRRADMARRLIRQGLALSEVAFAAGFADQSHMNRIFVSKYGITPGAYAAATV